MGVKICGGCGGSGDQINYCDDKYRCDECGGSGVVRSDDPADDWKEAVIINGRVEIRDIDITR